MISSRLTEMPDLADRVIVAAGAAQAAFVGYAGSVTHRNPLISGDITVELDVGTRYTDHYSHFRPELPR